MAADDTESDTESSVGDGKIFDPDGALSREFLVRRGHCCEDGCKNCPYGFRSNTPAR